MRKCAAMGAAKYAANHGTWRERAAAMLPDLESGKLVGSLSYSWFESIFREWQREGRIMFAIMPESENTAMALALRDMLGEAV